MKKNYQVIAYTCTYLTMLQVTVISPSAQESRRRTQAQGFSRGLTSGLGSRYASLSFSRLRYYPSSQYFSIILLRPLSPVHVATAPSGGAGAGVAPNDKLNGKSFEASSRGAGAGVAPKEGVVSREASARGAGVGIGSKGGEMLWEGPRRGSRAAVGVAPSSNFGSFVSRVLP
jgi:hypothetical protein